MKTIICAGRNCPITSCINKHPEEVDSRVAQYFTVIPEEYNVISGTCRNHETVELEGD